MPAPSNSETVVLHEEPFDLNKEFRRTYALEQKAYRRTTDLSAKIERSLDSYDDFVSAMNKWFELKTQRNELLQRHLAKHGLSTTPSEGCVRIYRGVEWPWDTKKVLPNQYWIEDIDHAMDFAKQGDVVMLDLPEKDIYRVRDPEKAGEIQLPNPDNANGAQIIIRNGNLVNPNNPIPPSLKNLLLSILNDRNTKPKTYSVLHDEYVQLDN